MDLLIGYSLGEYVVVCVFGVFGLEDVIKVVVWCGVLFDVLVFGGMLVVLFFEVVF